MTCATLLLLLLLPSARALLAPAPHLLTSCGAAARRHPLSPRMALSAGDAFPPELLGELCSARARQAGKRALIFFYDGDDAFGDELRALDEVGGELYLRACEVIAVRNPDGASSAAPARYPFLNFVEDRRDRRRGTLGAETCVSYLVDATGAVVSTSAAAGGHARHAMEAAEQQGWEREPGWVEELTGASSGGGADGGAGGPPSADERRAADAARRDELRRALRLQVDDGGREARPAAEPDDLQGQVKELFSTGIFAEWADPDPAQFPNPLGERAAGAAARVGGGARDAARALEDDAFDALNDAMGETTNATLRSAADLPRYAAEVNGELSERRRRGERGGGVD